MLSDERRQPETRRHPGKGQTVEIIRKSGVGRAWGAEGMNRKGTEDF